MTTKLHAALLSLALLSSLACAQTLNQELTKAADNTYTLAVEARVVTMPVTVRDAKGNLLQTLTPDDFTLTEDGRLQAIRYFTRRRDLPMTLGLVVDTSGSQKSFIKSERNASRMFFGTMLSTRGDTAFLVRVDNAITLLSPATASQADLRTALERLEEKHEPRSSLPIPEDTDPDTARAYRNPRAGTLLYDSIAMVCRNVASRAQGRNAIVLLTDGRDNGSILSLGEAVEAAQRTDTVIYSVLYTNEPEQPRPQTMFGGPAKPTGRQVLETISQATGGHTYQVTRKQPLEKIYGYIEEEMRLQYTLGYTPTATAAPPGYRRIELKARDKSWQVQTRSGYYAATTEQPPS